MGIDRLVSCLLYFALSMAAQGAYGSEALGVVYKTVNGHEILADVSLPDASGPHPAILFLHGGALIQGSREWILPWQKQRYVEAGFAFVSVDYRLAPESKLPEILTDVEDAYTWMRERGAQRFNIDKDRISVVGYSAGGYLALAAGYRVSPPPKAIVSFYGYGDITGDWYATPSDEFLSEGEITEQEARAVVGDTLISGTPFDMEHRRGDFYVWTRQQGNWPVELTGRNPKADKKWFKQFEPIHNVSEDYPPTLLLHGKADVDVPFDQSRQMAGILERKGVTYQLITKDEWGHMFDGPNQTPELDELFDQVTRFLAEYGKR